MHEKAKRFFNTIPEGIGIHGTDLASGKEISRKGFKARRGEDKKIHYVYVPGLHGGSLQLTKRNLLLHAEFPINAHAFKHTRSHRNFREVITGNKDYNKPAVVLFRPLEPIGTSTATRWEFSTHDIPADHILGVVPLDLSKNNPVDTYRSVRNFLVQKLRQSSEPQSPAQG